MFVKIIFVISLVKYSNGIKVNSTNRTFKHPDELIFNNLGRVEKYSPKDYTENIFLPVAPQNYHPEKTHETLSISNQPGFNFLNFQPYLTPPNNYMIRQHPPMIPEFHPLTISPPGPTLAPIRLPPPLPLHHVQQQQLQQHQFRQQHLHNPQPQRLVAPFPNQGGFNFNPNLYNNNNNYNNYNNRFNAVIPQNIGNYYVTDNSHKPNDNKQNENIKKVKENEKEEDEDEDEDDDEYEDDGDDKENQQEEHSHIIPRHPVNHFEKIVHKEIEQYFPSSRLKNNQQKEKTTYDEKIIHPKPTAAPPHRHSPIETFEDIHVPPSNYDNVEKLVQLYNPPSFSPETHAAIQYPSLYSQNLFVGNSGFLQQPTFSEHYENSLHPTTNYKPQTAKLTGNPRPAEINSQLYHHREPSNEYRKPRSENFEVEFIPEEGVVGDKDHGEVHKANYQIFTRFHRKRESIPNEPLIYYPQSVQPQYEKYSSQYQNPSHLGLRDEIEKLDETSHENKEQAIAQPKEDTGPRKVLKEAKYFQDFFAAQLTPHELEFGHVCENPHDWEERYERKDMKNHRHQGKVRWGDTKGGFGEHYWDLNHHNTNNDGASDDGSYKAK